MFKLLGQFLALVAMMASVLNAQCAVSCTLKLVIHSPSSDLSAIDLNQTQHACCPHHGAPKPKEQKHSVPCPPPLPAASKDRSDHKNASTASILAIVAADISHGYPLPGHVFIGPRLPSDWRSPSQPSAISLRI